MRPVLPLSICGMGLFILVGCGAQPTISHGELVGRTQELVSAVAVGNQTPWKKYFADDCMFFDEKGENMNKQSLVANITPLPEGSSGTITVEKAQSHIEGNVAILGYDLDETEIVFGQLEKARYHETDTWLLRDGEWKIVAGQVLRYYADPAAGASDAREMKDYVGIYQIAAGKTLAITQEDGHLFRQRDSQKVELFPEAPTIFFRKGVEGRILFRRDKQGEVDALIDRRNNEDVLWTKVAGVSKK